MNNQERYLVAIPVPPLQLDFLTTPPCIRDLDFPYPRAQDIAAVPVDHFTISNRLSLRLDIVIAVGKVLLS